ncbi:MAG: HAD family hydrolase [Mycobacteriales bacterium]
MGDLRLVATDLDGTIVRPDNSVSARTRAALQAVKGSGRVLVLVTGRPLRWMTGIADAAGHAGLAICSNGAVRYDLHTEQVLGRQPIQADVLEEVTSRLRVAIPGVLFGAEYGDGFGFEPGYLATDDAPADLVAMQSVTGRPAVKLLARHTDLSADEMLARAQATVADLVTVTHSARPGTGLLEISLLGVTKASELSRFAAEHGIDAGEVLAFGDMPNDIPMLRWAGRSVAVANAHPDARAAADETTASVDDDGVAQVLELLLTR